MKRAIYSIPLLGLSLVGCGAERSDDPIVAKFDATIYDGLPVPFSYSYVDPETNESCTLSLAVAMVVDDGLKALISISYSYDCDGGSINGTYTEGSVADVEVVQPGAQYKISFGSVDFPTTLSCTMDAARALQCADQNQEVWAFQIAN